MTHDIFSINNTLIKHILKLTNNRYYRQDHNSSVIYGDKSIISANQQQMITDILVKDKYYNQYYPLFRNDNIKWHIITNQAIFKKINPLQLDYPICALIKYKPQPSLKSSLTNNCILLDNIQDPGNLGNIFRTVAAVTNNKTYILLSSGSVDAYHPKVLRASMGTQFALPILQNIDLATFITSYTNNKGQVFACHSGSNQQQLYHYNFSQYSRIALVFGNEGQGISTHILAAVNNYIYIPMAQCVESINVASAVAVILYELYRQSFI